MSNQVVPTKVQDRLPSIGIPMKSKESLEKALTMAEPELHRMANGMLFTLGPAPKGARWKLTLESDFTTELVHTSVGERFVLRFWWRPNLVPIQRQNIEAA